MIHRQHLSRHLPAALPLEGCQRGDVFFYCGPPRRGAGNCWLTAGMQGEVIEAGLIEGLRTRSVVECRALVEPLSGSVRLRFKGFPELCSLEQRHLSQDPPPCRWEPLKLLF